MGKKDSKEEEGGKEEMIYSFSRLTSYNQCPYSFYLSYIAEMEQGNNSWGVGGKHSHDVIEAFLKGEIDKDDLADHWMYSMPQLSFPTMKDDYLFRYLEDCYEFFDNFSGVEEEIIGIEREFLIDIDGIKLRGFIDLETRTEDGNIQLVDWKTSGKSSFVGKKLKEKARQLYLYAISQFEHWGMWPNKMQFRMLKYKGEIIEIPFTQKGLNEAKKWLKDTVAKIESDTKFERKEDFFFCRNLCGFTQCPSNGNYEG